MPAPPVLIAAQSGRALAEAARRSGYAPLVADLFADEDTQRIAAAHRLVASDGAGGLAPDALAAALRDLAGGRDPVGLVLGSGFEHCPARIAALGRDHRVFGNDAGTVSATGDPVRFAAACASADVPHPDRGTDGDRGPDWLDKRIGAAGGAHVRVARGPVPPGHYRQRRLPGRSVSVLFLADRRNAAILDFSEQWSDPVAGAPYRYGGGARPGDPGRHADAMSSAVARLVPRLRLAGLNSADFQVCGQGFALLEINPRPGASLDYYPHADLFRCHIDACAGRLPERPPRWSGGHAACILYAPCRLRVPGAFAWPDWTADQQPGNSVVPPGAPICTMLATAEDAAAARALLTRRAAEFLGRANEEWTRYT